MYNQQYVAMFNAIVNTPNFQVMEWNCYALLLIKKEVLLTKYVIYRYPRLHTYM